MYDEYTYIQTNIGAYRPHLQAHNKNTAFVVFLLLTLLFLLVFNTETYSSPPKYLNKFNTSIGFINDTTAKSVAAVLNTAAPSSVSGSNPSIWALKFNVLYTILITPNIEVEYMFGKRYSISLEGEYANWATGWYDQKYGLWSISPEFRYWFAEADNYWQGHYLGVFGQGGQYNFKALNQHTGVQGQHIGLGLIYGYVFDVSKHFDTQNKVYFELGMGIGFIHSPYSKYYRKGFEFCRSESGYKNYIGPVKIKASLIFRLGKSNYNDKRYVIY
jgi:hypothetical protein